jgi:hypothetical protein
MYKPNFCAECGERVVRARWYPWTSRRFCRYCLNKSLRARFTAPVLAAVALLGAGFFAGKSMRQPSPPLIVQNGQGLTVPAQWTPNQNGRRTSVAGVTSGIENVGVPSKRNATASVEPISLCGARTKKGAMCTRRVHGAVRCWQHLGQPAILPPEKLLVKK